LPRTHPHEFDQEFARMQVQVTGLDVLTVSIVVIFVGRFLTTHIAVLQNYNIPPAQF
jgi:hypothetical protein